MVGAQTERHGTWGWYTPLDVNPAVYTFFTSIGPSAMARTVDDFWIATPPGTDHGENTVTALEAAFGPGVVVKRGTEAAEYAGYTIAQSPDRRRITLRMSLHVMDAVGRFEPKLLDGVRPSAELTPQRRKGALMKLAEKLKSCPQPRKGNPSSPQSRPSSRR